MSHLPLSILAFFLFTTPLALFAFAKAAKSSKLIIAGSILWMAAQSSIAVSGFYLSAKTQPPHFLLAVGPPMILIAILFATAAGRRFLDGMALKWCVLFHAIRVLVEINLYWLFLYKQVPALMTFEAGNLDIMVGLTAPVIWWAFSRRRSRIAKETHFHFCTT